MRYLIRSSLFASVLLCASPSAGVLVVGPPGSGAAFSDVQPAIDAAQPGDTVLVLAGTYGTASITKPLQLIGAGSDLVTLQGPNTAPQLVVTSIPVGETVVVTGLDLQSLFVGFVVPQAMARIASNGGTVVLQDVVLEDHPESFPHTSGNLDVNSSSLVLIESCVLVGGNGGGVGLTSPGMSAAASTVWMMNSTVQGGTDATLPGADAIQCTASTLYLGACEVQGGQGGIPFGCGYQGGAGVFMTGGLLKAVGPLGHIGGGDSPTGYSTWICGTGKGGVGIHVAGGAQAIVAASLTVEGGLHDQHLFPGSGAAEAIVVDGGSSLSTSPFLYPTLAADPRTVVGGGSVTFLLKGNPLALGSLFFALDLGPPTSFAGVDGAAILPGGARLLVTVPLDAAGQGSFTLPVPAIPALVGVVGAFQVLETAAPQKALSNPVFVTISG